VCAGTELTLVSTTVPVAQTWGRSSVSVTIPSSGCEVQALRLVGVPGEFRRPVSVWLDNVQVVTP